MTALPGDDPSKPGASAPDHGSLPAPVVAWQHKIGPKATLLFPLASDVSVLGVVLKGSVSLTAIEGGNAKVLAPWGSFVAPSAGLKLQALDSEASVVLAVVTNPASFVRPATASQAKPIPPKKREAPLAVEDLRTCRDLSWAGGAAHARLGFEADRSLRASLGILLMSSDMPMSEHAHASGWEVSITLRAKGMLMLPGRQVSVGPGMTVVVPNATTHSWLPGGSEPFLAIQLYLPPGPEQRFKALASEGTH
jgi:mannose-6-phosphate isomerase-like protein (cupin superfamily)